MVLVGQPALAGPTVLAEQLFLGKDLLPWLLLAIGGALTAANIAAVVRPPREDPKDPNSPRRDPISWTRAAPFALLGLVVSVWAIASLVR